MRIAKQPKHRLVPPQARKCGVRVFGRAQPLLRHCSITDCGGNGVSAGGDAALVMEDCGVARCAEDGIVGMQVRDRHHGVCCTSTPRGRLYGIAQTPPSTPASSCARPCTQGKHWSVGC